MNQTNINLSVNLSQSSGPIKPLHGVNNGPICYGSMVDVTEYYRELGVPGVRIHDPNWPHPREVDYYTIFPDFSKDARDPASYDFRSTDTYIQSIAATGAEIVYRLGVSIEHTAVKYHVHPPSDFDKWAVICEMIIRHYNEGWADGFQYGIRYWEIWNEPEGYPDTPPDKNAMWSGSHEEFFELYRITSSHLKQAFPDLMIGGFAYTYVHPVFLRAFLTYVRDHKLPMDFFSWHTYTAKPEVLASRAQEIRTLLDDMDLQSTETQLNEWNYAPPASESVIETSKQIKTQQQFERMKNEEGASFDAAVLSLMQDAPVDGMYFYDAAPSSWWSFFNTYGVPQKAYYAFKAFKYLVDLGHRVPVLEQDKADPTAIYHLAAVNNKQEEAAVLLANHSEITKSVAIQLILPPGRQIGSVNLTWTDRERTEVSEVLPVESISDGNGILMDMPPFSVCLAELMLIP